MAYTAGQPNSAGRFRFVSRLPSVLALLAILALAVGPWADARPLNGTAVATSDGAARGVGGSSGNSSSAAPPRTVVTPGRAVPHANCTTYVVVFGDSMSDTGNVYNYTAGIIPGKDAYWDGRFCNGPMWVDYLSSAMHAASTATAGARPHIEPLSDTQQPRRPEVWSSSAAYAHDSSGSSAAGGGGGGGGCQRRIVKFLNYAYGGATACASRALISNSVPDLRRQVSMFLEGAPAPSRPLVDGELAAEQAMDNITDRAPAQRQTTADDPDGSTAIYPIKPYVFATLAAAHGENVTSAAGNYSRACMNVPLVRPAPPPGGLLSHRQCGGAAGRSSGSSSTGGTDDSRQSTIIASAAASSPPDGYTGPIRIINIWIGHNDFLGPYLWEKPHGPANVVNNVTACIGASLDRLQSALGPHDVILVWTVAPMGASPVLPNWARPTAWLAVHGLNVRLEHLVERARLAHPSGPAVYLYDAHLALSCGLGFPKRYGMLNSTGACLNLQKDVVEDLMGPMEAMAFMQIALASSAKVCPNPNDYVWYDGMHLTTAAQRELLAMPLLAELEGKGGTGASGSHC